MIQMHLILIAVWLFKFHTQKLKKCNRLREIGEVLETKVKYSSVIIIREIMTLKEKYFVKNKNLIE